MNSQRFWYMHEQHYGLITSLLIHSIVFILFFTLSVHKNTENIKTYYIQFTQIKEQTLQEVEPFREIKKPKYFNAIEERSIQTRHKEEVKEETPLIKEPSLKEPEPAVNADIIEKHEAVIKNDSIESNELVNIASTSDSGSQSHTTLHQGGGSMIGNVLSAASSGRSGVIDTEFGSTGAPAFLKRQMPVYPALARKLG